MIFSPNKPKNGGITAGIARAGAGKDSATGNGADDSDEVRPPGFPQIRFLVLRVHYVTCPGFGRSISIFFCASPSCFSTPLLAFAKLATQ
jgi:hypothetical protein